MKDNIFMNYILSLLRVFFNSKYIPLSILLLLIIPTTAFAAVADSIATLGQYLSNFLNALAALITGWALVMFIGGILKYIKDGGNEELRAEGRKTMLYGVIMLFIIVSLWGIINLLADTFQFTLGQPIVMPNVPKP